MINRSCNLISKINEGLITDVYKTCSELLSEFSKLRLNDLEDIKKGEDILSEILKTITSIRSSKNESYQIDEGVYDKLKDIGSYVTSGISKAYLSLVSSISRVYNNFSNSINKVRSSVLSCKVSLHRQDGELGTSSYSIIGKKIVVHYQYDYSKSLSDSDHKELNFRVLSEFFAQLTRILSNPLNKGSNKLYRKILQYLSINTNNSDNRNDLDLLVRKDYFYPNAYYIGLVYAFYYDKEVVNKYLNDRISIINNFVRGNNIDEIKELLLDKSVRNNKRLIYSYLIDLKIYHDFSKSSANGIDRSNSALRTQKFLKLIKVVSNQFKLLVGMYTDSNPVEVNISNKNQEEIPSSRAADIASDINELPPLELIHKPKPKPYKPIFKPDPEPDSEPDPTSNEGIIFSLIKTGFDKNYDIEPKSYLRAQKNIVIARSDFLDRIPNGSSTLYHAGKYIHIDRVTNYKDTARITAQSVFDKLIYKKCFKGIIEEPELLFINTELGSINLFKSKSWYLLVIKDMYEYYIAFSVLYVNGFKDSLVLSNYGRECYMDLGAYGKYIDAIEHALKTDLIKF
jgi:hypothetical protein